ncbi:hypothetical protein [Sphaerisporangium rubeum]|nr:hypothetical protein [Sphaerisporangium rubeum]
MPVYVGRSVGAGDGLPVAGREGSGHRVPVSPGPVPASPVGGGAEGPP